MPETLGGESIGYVRAFLRLLAEVLSVIPVNK